MENYSEKPLSDEVFKEHNGKNKILSAPVRYHLVDVLKSLQFGRTTQDQYQLEDMMEIAVDNLAIGSEVWVFCNWGLCKGFISERLKPTTIERDLVQPMPQLYRVAIKFEDKKDLVKHNFHYTRKEIFLSAEEAVTTEGKVGEMMNKFTNHMFKAKSIVHIDSVTREDIENWKHGLWEERMGLNEPVEVESEDEKIPSSEGG